MDRRLRILSLALFAALFWATQAPATFAQDTTDEPTETPQDTEAPATVTAAAQLLAIVTTIDEDAQLTANGATFIIDDVTVTLVFDVNADRMRLFSQVIPSDTLSSRTLQRVMQANFDTALDARYAIAQGVLWSTYMHRLTTLTQDDFVSGLAQTVTLVKTYGTTFSSGAMSFGGGDSNAEIQKLLESLLNDGQDI